MESREMRIFDNEQLVCLAFLASVILSLAPL